MAKAEGVRGLRVKALGESGLDCWRHELFRALTRACLAGLRTCSTGKDARGGHRHKSGVGPPRLNLEACSSVWASGSEPTTSVQSMLACAGMQVGLQCRYVI